ncbi:MAG: DUF5686 family protein, partial [Schleiferiaceae bacterium]|nr:DUF5686 family protein [Schleiferiaceae bacterium]
MNWQWFFRLCIFTSAMAAQAQSQHVVWDALAQAGVPNARISVSGIGVVSDLNGYYNWPDSLDGKYLSVKASGYQVARAPLSDTLFLSRQPLRKIEDQYVHLGERLQLGRQLIRTVIALKGPNNPDKQPAYSYQSYNLDKITIGPLKPGFPESRFTKWHRFTEQSDLMLSESVTAVHHQRPNRRNEVVQAAKVSGFQDPAAALLATRYQSFNFYQDLIYCFGKHYSSPLGVDAMEKYQFLVTDTLFDVATQRQLFAVFFRPQGNPKFDAFLGEMLIDAATYALRGIYVVPFESDGIGLHVQQYFEWIDETIWFPVAQQSKMEIKLLTLLGHKPALFLNRKISDVAFGALPQAEITVPDVRLEEDTALSFDAIRPRPLTPREETTLRTIDSIGGELLFDRKLNWVKTLSTAQIRVRAIDLDMGRFVNYNYNEQVRLGLGGNTNERLFRHAQIGGWFGYSFRDQVMKYGYSGTVFLNRDKNLAVTALYDFDLYEAGGTQFLANSNRLIVTSNQYRRMFIRLFDRVSETRLMLSYHPVPNLHTRWFASNQNRFVLSDYRFVEIQNGQERRTNGFVTTQFGFSVEWRPNDRYFQGREMVRTIKRSKPVLRAQVAHSVPDLLGSDFPFTRIDFEFQNQYQTLRYG